MSLLSWEEYKEGKRIEIKLPEDELPVKAFFPPPTGMLTMPDIHVLNAATAENLLEVKGIGPKTAEKIVSGQPYADMKDLTEVISNPLYLRVSDSRE